MRTTRKSILLVCLVMLIGMFSTALAEDEVIIDIGGGKDPDDCLTEGGCGNTGGAGEDKDEDDPAPTDRGNDVFDFYGLEYEFGDERADLVSDIVFELSDFDATSGPEDVGLFSTRITFDSDDTNDMELVSYCVSEAIPEIRVLGVQHSDAGLNAKIRKFTQSPHGGTIWIYLNDADAITIPTDDEGEGPLTASDLNLEILFAIGGAGFQVIDSGNYFIVTRDLHLGSGWDLNKVQIYVADTGLTSSEVALEAGTVDSTDCSEAGGS